MAPAIKACIFDMDGLLLNTEDLITTCINTILTNYDKPPLPWSIKARMQGRIASDSDDIMLQWAKLPITKAEYSAQLDALRTRIFPTSDTLPGVEDLLKELASRNNVLALATSSSRSKFAMKTVKWTDLFRCFPEELRVLGDDTRVSKHKPAPDIYLCALNCLNQRNNHSSVSAEECLVFEDSIQGVDAGKQARMQVVWCPHEGLLHELCHGDGDEIRQHLRQTLSLPDDLPIQGATVQDLADQITKVTNGMVTLLTTLQDFPYQQFDL